jgi:hypothetical protein
VLDIREARGLSVIFNLIFFSLLLLNKQGFAALKEKRPVRFPSARL